MPDKPILVIDFDGVLSDYRSGWQGATVINDPPVPGAVEFLEKATKHFRVAIYSSRSHQRHGRKAMREWLSWHATADDAKPDPTWLREIEWPKEKPPAFLTIDDRALTFDGTWPSIENLLAFQPWHKRKVG